MKEMQYSSSTKVEVLDTGYCLGFLYYILSLGTHPTAYIKIPEDHKYYKKDYEDIDVNIDLGVHGGLTYSKSFLYIDKNKKIDGWFIGWDYAHYGDYTGFEEMYPQEYRTGGYKWTTEEIFKEVKEACYQLAKVKD